MEHNPNWSLSCSHVGWLTPQVLSAAIARSWTAYAFAHAEYRLLKLIRLSLREQYWPYAQSLNNSGR